APDATWAWAIRLLEGIFMAAYTTLGLSLMGDLLDVEESSRLAAGLQRQKGRRMGGYRGLGSLAFAGGALIGGRLADAYSLSMTMALCAAIYSGAALLALWLKDVDAGETESSPVAAAEATRPAPMLTTFQQMPLLFLVGVTLWTAAHSASASMWPNYMAQLGYTKTAISSLWGLAALVEMPSMFVAGALSDTVGAGDHVGGGRLWHCARQLGLHSGGPNSCPLLLNWFRSSAALALAATPPAP
ncbi:MAG: MFS transporter, partial [Caldilineaceae bacterium]|nr:MFS transporter [Caldilineaceae bacterium]